VKVVVGGIALTVVAGAAALAVWQPWHDGKAAGELGVQHATLVPGRIVLVLVNGSEDPARVAEVILNDAFVDFSGSQRTIAPGDAERIVIPYHWINGEAYDIELMTSTGRTVAYQIEEAA
jgi:zinc transporter, ZIP family